MEELILDAGEMLEEAPGGAFEYEGEEQVMLGQGDMASFLQTLAQEEVEDETLELESAVRVRSEPRIRYSREELKEMSSLPLSKLEVSLGVPMVGVKFQAAARKRETAYSGRAGRAAHPGRTPPASTLSAWDRAESRRQKQQLQQQKQHKQQQQQSSKPLPKRRDNFPQEEEEDAAVREGFKERFGEFRSFFADDGSFAPPVEEESQKTATAATLGGSKLSHLFGSAEPLETAPEPQPTPEPAASSSGSRLLGLLQQAQPVVEQQESPLSKLFAVAPVSQPAVPTGAMTEEDLLRGRPAPAPMAAAPPPAVSAGGSRLLGMLSGGGSNNYQHGPPQVGKRIAVADLFRSAQAAPAPAPAPMPAATPAPGLGQWFPGLQTPVQQYQQPPAPQKMLTLDELEGRM